VLTGNTLALVTPRAPRRAGCCSLDESNSWLMNGHGKWTMRKKRGRGFKGKQLQALQAWVLSYRQTPSRILGVLVECLGSGTVSPLAVVVRDARLTRELALVLRSA
jgi:hypothetical protein